MLRPWPLHIRLDDVSGSTLQERLLNCLITQIQQGRLQPGDVLPGSRVLAEQLGVNRKTVQWAFDDMIAQGWLVSEPRRATRVSPVLPEVRELEKVLVPAHAKLRVPNKLDAMQPAASLAEQEQRVSNDGTPDLRLIPYEELARATRRGLLESIRSGTLGYGDPRGTPRLRRAIQQMLTQDRFMRVALEQICVVRGSQMGIFLSAQLLDPSKGVIVMETLSYPPARATFTSLGFEVVDCRQDEQGLDTEHLYELLQKHCVAAVYTTPHHQYPTTVCMSSARRLALLNLSLQYDFVVIEDDYDHEFHYDNRPVAPLASLEDAQNVIHIGSLSKVFAPGLRLGYMVAGAELIDRIAGQIMLVDRQGNAIVELAVADLMESGLVKRHIRKARKVYQQRRDLAASLLFEALADKVSFDLPAGGMALWLRCSKVLSEEALAQLRLLGFIGEHFFAQGEDKGVHIRFGFASLNEQEIAESVQQLQKCLLDQGI
ncbi:PLP-dependent aminotransferase family protein [Bowmanella yangjiangensis]|uniref:PLP-dependent aminotransferase family protein n=1 Tax=Bowmanella yangjiangensis TaxID=2811230 RepID=A0ABS3CVB9_9ALTE|nr:PLP-dependent aminotransferase family protein [Bowmanella yangjiangensis]MBN7819579.1 PLP-dependent aminotransferase family protein [Bowmanella yangjiangensis]